MMNKSCRRGGCTATRIVVPTALHVGFCSYPATCPRVSVDTDTCSLDTVLLVDRALTGVVLD